ncbi:phage major capsid protein [Knoellia koreensis]|uniref:Phage major capsid protein n=1 Tax=Knoellia koreensis TaxID=2730921 RepID=A0A849HDG7_9MICO|nr:phage major capsid protein [Knoellia sp. DB2414S]NNM45139.1 phage major capsid protein [Knoellia sp. DB2414S]
MTAVKTSTTPEGMHLDVKGFPAAEILPEALIITSSTKAGFVDGDEPAVRVPFVDFDDDAAFVPEGAAITEADPDMSEVVVNTGKVAVLARVSREQWETGDAADILSSSVQRALLRKANGAFLAQPAPVAPAVTPPAGLLNLAPTDGGAIAADLDELADAVATIEGANGAATNIIAAPDAWAALSKLKTQTGSNASLLGAGTDAATRQLLGIPVKVSNAMPSGDLLVIDKTAVLSAYGEVKLALSEHAFFASDSLGVRATFRFGQKLVDPARVVKVAVTLA